MRHLLLNKLSLAGQFATSGEFEDAVTIVLHCLDVGRVAFANDAARFWFDDTVESLAALNDGTLFTEALSRVERDVRLKWYKYTRDRGHPPEGELISVEILSGDRTSALMGDVFGSPIELQSHWISLAGMELFEPTTLLLRIAQERELSVRNSNSVQAFWTWWPRYVSSPKHRKQGYYAGPHWVSPMPLTEAEAQEALDISVPVGDGREAAFRGRTIRFVLTHPDGTIYHGFEPTQPP